MELIGRLGRLGRCLSFLRQTQKEEEGEAGAKKRRLQLVEIRRVKRWSSRIQEGARVGVPCGVLFVPGKGGFGSALWCVYKSRPQTASDNVLAS